MTENAGEKPTDFHGYGGDIESVGEIIRLWTTRNGRWMSPKYLCGESYGTVRAARRVRCRQRLTGAARDRRAGSRCQTGSPGHHIRVIRGRHSMR